MFNKIKQMTPKCSDIFAENVFEIKTEIDLNNPNNFETLTNVLSSDSEDVNNSNIIQLERVYFTKCMFLFYVFSSVH